MKMEADKVVDNLVVSVSNWFLCFDNELEEPSWPPSTLKANVPNEPKYLCTWVRDDSYPLYQYSNCPIIDAEFNCQLYGRPDSDYLKYRWPPLNCCIVICFTFTLGDDICQVRWTCVFIEMRGRSMMFVGDSLGRNQWDSLISPRMQTQMITGDPLSTFRTQSEHYVAQKVTRVQLNKFVLANSNLSNFKAPYLVDMDVVQGTRVHKLEGIYENGNAWRMADMLVFNTGHWWTHKGSLQGDMNRLVAMGKGLRTWSNWVDTNVDRTRTEVLFQSISPTHYE
ncbi:hypothetical protein CXB51_023193 [Gossypium anomalum]|uniref:Trichome birefringence-like N-terminal domain-containing protein n=1 Tax=Gossypium anomalum TaxID=47600 RepID=A0A8J6CXB4_9ROSI|nr:hypothetical protein CXB51_023193 [Gossypium anomalum]